MRRRAVCLSFLLIMTCQNQIRQVLESIRRYQTLHFFSLLQCGCLQNFFWFFLLLSWMLSVQLLLSSRHDMKLTFRPPWREQHTCKVQPSVVQTAAEWRWFSAKLPKDSLKHNYLSWLLARAACGAQPVSSFWACLGDVWRLRKGG